MSEIIPEIRNALLQSVIDKIALRQRNFEITTIRYLPNIVEELQGIGAPAEHRTEIEEAEKRSCKRRKSVRWAEDLETIHQIPSHGKGRRYVRRSKEERKKKKIEYQNRHLLPFTSVFS